MKVYAPEFSIAHKHKVSRPRVQHLAADLRVYRKRARDAKPPKNSVAGQFGGYATRRALSQTMINFLAIRSSEANHGANLKELVKREDGKAGLAPRHVIVVRAGSFAFRFETAERLRECIKYYEKKTRPTSRIAANALAADLGEDWRKLRGFWSLCVLASASFQLISCSQPPIHVSDDAPTLKIAVMADGRITVDGIPATMDSLRVSFKRLAVQKGVVWYHREAGQAQAPPGAAEVIQAVIENQLPIKLSSRPDYSDAIGPGGKPLTK